MKILLILSLACTRTQEEADGFLEVRNDFEENFWEVEDHMCFIVKTELGEVRIVDTETDEWWIYDYTFSPPNTYNIEGKNVDVYESEEDGCYDLTHSILNRTVCECPSY
jgi:hypothetical protein